METIQMPVQKRVKRSWSPEKKLALLEEWRNGVPLEELCRKHGVAAQQMYKWRRDLSRGLAARGELVPKSQVVLLQKRTEELEKALGRKAMEVDVLKKVFELKGLRLPEDL